MAKSLENDARQPSDAVRSLVSFLVFVHLFCVFAALYASQAPTPPGGEQTLKERLLAVLRPYTQLLNFESFARFDLTQGTIDDVDNRIEFVARGGKPDQADDWRNFRSGWRGSDRYVRYQRLADLLAFTGGTETDDARRSSALITKAIGEHLWNQQKIEAEHLRSRQHTLLTRDEVARDIPARRNPEEPSHLREGYRAELIFVSGRISVVPKSSRGEVAPVSQGKN